MTSGSRLDKREMLFMAADGGVITAGVFAAMIGLAFILEWTGVAPMGEPQGTGLKLVLSIISFVLQAGGMIVGPLVVWVLYRRGFGRKALLSVILGYFIGGALFTPILFVASGLNWLVAKITPYEYAGAIAFLVVVVAAFVAALLWANATAIRDLRASHENVPLDVARIAATVAVLAFAGGVVVITLRGENSFEAMAFVFAAGINGALAFLSGSTVLRLFEGSGATPAVAQ